MHMAPQILNQLIWHQIIVAFGWNRSASGDVLVVTEPVATAFSQAVAYLLSQTSDPEAGLDDFVAQVRSHLAAVPSSPSLAPVIAFVPRSSEPH